MKKTLCGLALAALSAGCGNQGLNLNVGGLNLNDVQTVAKTVQQVQQAARDFSEAEEIELGQGVASSLLGSAPLLADRKVQRYVNQVGRLLAMQTERPDLPWRFAVLDDGGMNAFAAPGGYIVITKGLLASMASEAELAGVLAHEIAHVVRKHHLKAIKKEAEGQLLGDLAGAAVAKGVKGYGGAMLANVASGVGKQMYTKALDKDDEFEADRMGVVIAARAGYDPFGLPAALQTLQTAGRDHKGLQLMFSTHPAFDTRLQQLDLAMNTSFARFENQPALAPRFKAVMQAAKLVR